jgi:hypothetical protein
VKPHHTPAVPATDDMFSPIQSLITQVIKFFAPQVFYLYDMRSGIQSTQLASQKVLQPGCLSL